MDLAEHVESAEDLLRRALMCANDNDDAAPGWRMCSCGAEQGRLGTPAGRTCQYSSSRRRVATIHRLQWPVECSTSPTRIVNLRRSGRCHDSISQVRRPRLSVLSAQQPVSRGMAYRQVISGMTDESTQDAHRCSKSAPRAQPVVLLQRIVGQAGQPGHHGRDEEGRLHRNHTLHASGYQQHQRARIPSAWHRAAEQRPHGPPQQEHRCVGHEHLDALDFRLGVP